MHTFSCTIAVCLLNVTSIHYLNRLSSDRVMGMLERTPVVTGRKAKKHHGQLDSPLQGTHRQTPHVTYCTSKNNKYVACPKVIAHFIVCVLPFFSRGVENVHKSIIFYYVFPLPPTTHLSTDQF